MMEYAIAPPPAPAAAPAHPGASGAQAVYTRLSTPGAACRATAAGFLEQQLERVRDRACDLPPSPEDLPAWAGARTAAVAARYRRYRAERRAGAPRTYFAHAAHALFFLRQVAPTKLVDGAWLYGALRHWQECDYQPLAKTYLDELGGGVPGQNHVVLYRKLLDQYGLTLGTDLSAARYEQGAIQLALGQAGDTYLPEVLGYNLGYEQLPLHLLITAFELNELGIDPYYFTLHVTVDNAASGHAHMALAAVTRLMARATDRAAFWRRLRAGYLLNDLGASTTSVIASFDLDAELVRILADKAATGRDMHGDYCRVGGRTINDWLREPAAIPALLEQFEQTGWIRRGAPPEASRFWRLLEGERPQMFGVFTPYEKQVLADWISTTRAPQRAGAGARVPSFRARQHGSDAGAAAAAERARPKRPLIRHAGADGADGQPANALRALEQTVANAPDKAAAIAALLAQLAPACHHSAVGMMATRLFAGLTAL